MWGVTEGLEVDGRGGKGCELDEPVAGISGAPAAAVGSWRPGWEWEAVWRNLRVLDELLKGGVCEADALITC